MLRDVSGIYVDIFDLILSPQKADKHNSICIMHLQYVTFQDNERLLFFQWKKVKPISGFTQRLPVKIYQLISPFC